MMMLISLDLRLRHRKKHPVQVISRRYPMNDIVKVKTRYYYYDSK